MSEISDYIIVRKARKQKFLSYINYHSLTYIKEFQNILTKIGYANSLSISHVIISCKVGKIEDMLLKNRKFSKKYLF